MASNIHAFDEKVGLLKRGTVVGFDSKDNTIKVQLNNFSSLKSAKSNTINVPMPHSMLYNNGMFIGTAPDAGTPIIVGQGSGNQYYFVSYLAENPKYVPTLNWGELLIKSNDNTKITLDYKNNILIGSVNNKIHIDTSSNLITTSFNNRFNFTQASRNVDGIVKRDLRINSNYPESSKLEDDSYDKELITIGMDPTSTVSSTYSDSVKNPAFIEKRELIYEFQYDSDINDDLTESSLYDSSNSDNKTYLLPNRRKSRSDTMSLTLAAPNYLMETVKGTVIDIFGNILDLNRTKLQVGSDNNSFQSANKKDAFLNIKKLERKSLAYHFEINTRKNFENKSFSDYLESKADWSRNRSRFFFDIDKEGQFKLNIPCSSESGNIALLTRYENYSTFGGEDNNNPNKLYFNKDKIDIYPDSFAAPPMTLDKITPTYSTTERGSISIISENNVSAVPEDRILKTPIKHGTAYHDILQTCWVHKNASYLTYQNDHGDPANVTIDVDKLPKLENLVKEKIYTYAPYGSTQTPNLGGRSGSINLDGSIDLNIGANQSDRQSMWLDTAGGIVANIGRDRRNISAAFSLNGKLLIQVGGIGVEGDSRFPNSENQNGYYPGEIDIRVLNGDGYKTGGQATLVRISNDGVQIMTPGNIAVHAGQNMRLTANGSVFIEAEEVQIQKRVVKREVGGSI